MVEAMNSVAKLGVELNAEERNLLSVGYKNMLGAKRASWRILSVIKSKEEATGDTQHAALAKEYLERVGDEFTTKCNEILLTIDDYLLPSSKTGEAAVFYHKMKGDYYRYSAEIKSDADREEAKSQSLKAYEDATAIAESDLLPTNPIRLGLALNFSVFYYEIMADTERACNMAKQAFEDAAAELDSLDQKSSLIMRLIMDNLTLWTLDPAEDEDMVEAMNSVAKLGVELNAEERNLLSVGYKNMLGAKRASWRILSVIKSKEEATGDTQHAALAKEYLERVGDELTTKCNEILLTIDDYLLPSSKTGEAAVFYHKMKGDYYRYSAEIKSDADREEAKSQSLKAYEDATAIAESDLLPTNPIRLGLALNFSVFYYEIMADTERACNMAKQAFEDAAAELDSLDQKSSLIMRLIMDNLTLWTLDPAEDEEKKAHRGEVQVPNIFDLTNDLLDEVLGRLEIPDILRFGGVSKRLSQLVKEYLLKSRMRQKVFLPSSPFHSVSLRDSNVITAHEIKQVSDRPIHPHLSFPEILIVGSIDGTVLVVELCQSPQKLLLVNPLTKHHREIPHRPLRPHPQNLIEEDEIVNNYAYGIGWAGKPAGLIIVQLYRTFIENMQPCCEMYSLRDACWRKFAPLKGGVHIKQFAGTFLKESNSLYWLARKGKLHVILKLHLDLMLFTELAFPNVVKGVPEQILGRVHSKICALTRDYLGSDSLEVWALQEDESRINWSKLYTFSENEVYNSERSGFPKILTYTNDGSMFLLNTEDYETDSTEKHEVAKQFLTIYNLSENSLKELTSPTSLGYISRTQASVYTENTDFFMTGNTGESYAKKVSDHELKRACSLGKDIFKMIDGKCYEESTLSTTGDS